MTGPVIPRAALLATVAIAAGVAGCLGRTSLRDPHEGQLRLRVRNEVGSAICGVHVFFLGQTDEGPNRLPPDAELVTGQAFDVWVPRSDPHDTYQVHAVGCPYEPRRISGYAPSVIMNGPAMVVVYEEGNPSSKQAALELAHANTNTIQVAAKITRNPTPAARPARPAPPARNRPAR